jgi:hypothetical protein
LDLHVSPLFFAVQAAVIQGTEDSVVASCSLDIASSSRDSVTDVIAVTPSKFCKFIALLHFLFLVIVEQRNFTRATTQVTVQHQL